VGFTTIPDEPPEEEIDYTLKPTSKQGMSPREENVDIQKWLNTNNLLSGIEVSSALMGKSSRQWLLSRKLKSEAGVSGMPLKKLFQAIKQFERDPANKGLKIYAFSMYANACVSGKGCRNGECIPIPGAECMMNVNRRPGWLPGPSKKGIMWVAAKNLKAKEVRNIRFVYGSPGQWTGRARKAAAAMADKDPNIWIILTPGSFNLESTLKGFRRSIYAKEARTAAPKQPAREPSPEEVLPKPSTEGPTST
jgi:hypothetical protein